VAHFSGASITGVVLEMLTGKNRGYPGLALFETWDSTNVSRLGFCSKGERLGPSYGRLLGNTRN